MKSNVPVSIAMVAYNEEAIIQAVMNEFAHDVLEKLPPGSEYILYLDKPSDNTPRLAREIAGQLNITVIIGERNLGYAGAMKAALMAAKNSVVFYSDSSGKHRAKDFWTLLPHIEHYDIVTGSRTNRTDPLVRRVTTFLQQVLVLLLFNVPFKDYNTGFKVVRKEVIDACVECCKYTKQSFSTEFLIRALKKGYTVKSVPVTFTSRTDVKAGTNTKQLPHIIKNNVKGLLLLKKEFIHNEPLCP